MVVSDKNLSFSDEKYKSVSMHPFHHGEGLPVGYLLEKKIKLGRLALQARKLLNHHSLMSN